MRIIRSGPAYCFGTSTVDLMRELYGVGLLILNGRAILVSYISFMLRRVACSVYDRHKILICGTI
jgi:hypothetical protein